MYAQSINLSITHPFCSLPPSLHPLLIGAQQLEDKRPMLMMPTTTYRETPRFFVKPIVCLQLFMVMLLIITRTYTNTHNKHTHNNNDNNNKHTFQQM